MLALLFQERVSRYESWFLFNIDEGEKNLLKNFKFYRYNIHLISVIFFFILQAISTLLAISASVACVLACISATMHLAHLMRLECTPARVLNATCVCRPREQANVTASEASVKYMDLNCPEVESILTILLIFSSTCNAFGAIVAGWYSYLHWSTRRKRPKYVPVRTTTFDSSR